MLTKYILESVRVAFTWNGTILFCAWKSKPVLLGKERSFNIFLCIHEIKIWSSLSSENKIPLNWRMKEILLLQNLAPISFLAKHDHPTRFPPYCIQRYSSSPWKPPVAETVTKEYLATMWMEGRPPSHAQELVLNRGLAQSRSLSTNSPWNFNITLLIHKTTGALTATSHLFL